MELESEGLVENTYLSQLLRRHCRNGTFRNFEYLLRKRILPKKNDSNVQNILTSCDKDGYTLLHCAAEGGCVEIFEELIRVTDKISVDDTTYDGRTVLHIACKNGNLSLCESLMFDKNYKELLLEKKSNQGWNALHYAAANGSTKIVNLLEKNGLDILDVTTNGLSILDIACLHNHEELCKTLINRDDLSLLFYKADAHGWRVAHFAAMAGNKDILKYLIKKNLNIRMTTNRTKNVLHVSCEYGNYDICAEILDRYDGREYMLYETDDENWNALHYAAKGGNLKVYKTVEKFFENSARLNETTCDEKTVLHIACINKRTEICQYICDQESYTDIINSRGSLKGWTAAHYIAVEIKQDGTEENLIRMLVESGIDLKAVTTDGLTVLGVACEHRNRNLINYLLKTHSELLGVGIPYLKIAAKASNDINIQSQIYEALENYKGKRVDIIVKKKKT